MEMIQNDHYQTHGWCEFVIIAKSLKKYPNINKHKQETVNELVGELLRVTWFNIIPPLQSYLREFRPEKALCLDENLG